MGAVASALIGVFAVLFGLIANLLGIITGAFLGAAVNLFNWVTSENFISLSYTRLDNPFIALGWGLTKDLTNIIFVLALVAIGLGTALRITGYQAQKALPILIIIALLINFTPVICGLIVDASNIVMKFFISGGFAGGNNFVNYAFRQWESIGPLVGGVKFWDPTASHEATAAAVGSIVLVGFNFIAALIYLLLAFLFIFRYIAIWTLVILSPFAFACYILPVTRGVWSQWWKQFIQWSIIGVIAAFFLYLGDSLLNEATKTNFITGPMGEISGLPSLAPIMNSVLPYGISIAFLFLGLMMALSTSAMGANFAIGMAKAIPKMRPLAQRLGKGAGWAAKGFGAMEKGARRLETMAGKVPYVGKALKWGLAKPFAVFPAWATRAALGPTLEKYATRARKIDIGKDMKDLGIEEDIQGQLDYVDRASTNEQKLQTFAWMADKGTLQKSPQAWKLAAGLVRKFAKDPHFGKETGDIADVIPDQLDDETKINLEKTKEDREDMKKKIVKTAGKLSTEIEMKPVIDEEAARLLKDKVVKDTTEAQDLAARNVAARYIHLFETKSGDIKNIAKKSIESVIAGRALRDMTPGHIQAVANNFKTETVNKVLDNTFNKMFIGKTDEENRKILENYYLSDIKHARMINWSLTTPAGREFNPIWRKYLPKNKKGRPDFGAFEVEMFKKK